jgi:RHS repeat-associated protein
MYSHGKGASSHADEAESEKTLGFRTSLLTRSKKSPRILSPLWEFAKELRSKHIEAPSSGDRYKYTAREWDTAISLQYNRARYYDPTIGRWISQDPVGFTAGDSNLDRYVQNTPTMERDPSGLDSVADQQRRLQNFQKQMFDLMQKMMQGPMKGMKLPPAMKLPDPAMLAKMADAFDLATKTMGVRFKLKTPTAEQRLLIAGTGSRTFTIRDYVKGPRSVDLTRLINDMKQFLADELGNQRPASPIPQRVAIIIPARVTGQVMQQEQTPAPNIHGAPEIILDVLKVFQTEIRRAWPTTP